MPSRFPGVDPYLESQGFWPDFHATFINYWREALADALPASYEARIDERVNLVEVHPRRQTRRIEPDVAVTHRGASTDQAASAAPVAVATLEAVTLPLLIEEEERETYIEILHRPDRQLVAVLELLSPANKEEPGYTSYRLKRNAILRHPIHLVEVDLLHGGRRPPLDRDYPPGDYHALIAHTDSRPNASVCSWSVRQPLPSLLIPLLAPDPGVWVDLAAVFTTTFDRGRYAPSIDYTQLPTAIAEADREWALRTAQPPANPASPS